jgi:hypothetical protein
MDKETKPKILKFDNYLSMINNSVGSTQYQNLWVIDDNGNKIDITKDGELSCAVYVTSILKLFDLINTQKANVHSTLNAMLEFGWKEVGKEEAKKGDVLVWNSRKDLNNETHGHIGFYVGDNKAISNSTKLKRIVRHGWDYGGRRIIEKVLRWNKWE